jgi:NAD(P)-dependent dehydrogenase (short-subunit alcohol dehydrogenase family)
MSKPDVPGGAVIITGAASGIGRALAQRLIVDGAFVCACDVDEAGLAVLGKRPNLLVRVIDVRDRAALQAAVDAAEAAAGSIRGLAACAAVFKTRPFLEIDDALWDDTFAINLKGSLFAVQAVLPAMRRQKGGAILLFSSTIARSGAADGAHYAATKGGVLALARSVALETAANGIRVNVLSPGVTDTPQPRGNMTADELFGRAASIPLGRIGHVDDMVEAALFLLSEDASFITAQDLRINGGARLF